MKRIFAVAVIGLAVACSAPASTDETAETPPTPAESETDAVETPDAPTSPVNLVMGVYNAFEYGDIEGVTANFALGIVWNEAENSPYADQNPYEGADEVVNGVFARLGGEWDYFSATPSEFIADGDKVAAIGRYRAKHTGTGKEMDIPFVHVWTVEDGAITAFQQYTDTLTHTEVMKTD